MSMARICFLDGVCRVRNSHGEQFCTPQKCLQYEEFRVNQTRGVEK